MNPNPDLERVFPLSGGSTERVALHAPRIIATTQAIPGFVMGNRAFMRTWAGRRALQSMSTMPAPMSIVRAS